MNAFVELLLDLLYPPKCMPCGRLLRDAERTLCRTCSNGELPKMAGKPKEVPFFAECAAAFSYETPISDAILRLKFSGMQSYVRQLASWMADAVKEQLAGKFDLISWVPCSRLRVWTRGFDQAKLLALALAEELDAEAVCTLRKIKNNPKQSRAASVAARRANVMGVYRAVNPERFRNKRILLVDDVLTTGATLSECGKTLRLAGSGDLVCAVIAATNKENDK